MRLRWVFVPLLVVMSLALLAAACGGDSGPAATNADDPGPAAADDSTGGEPTSSGFVAPNVFMTFEGQRYQLRDVLQANLISDDFTEIGAASEANIDFDGELTVFRRQGDDAAVYTYSLAVDAEDEEGDLPALWNRWELVVDAQGEEPDLPDM